MCGEKFNVSTNHNIRHCRLFLFFCEELFFSKKFSVFLKSIDFFVVYDIISMDLFTIKLV